MMINSRQLRAAGFKPVLLEKVIAPQLEAAARSGMRTPGAPFAPASGDGVKKVVRKVCVEC